MSPTIKHKKALKRLAENGGNLGEAMRVAGYSKISSKTPKKMTSSKGWRELMDEYFPEEELAKLHAEQLGATSVIYKNRKQIELPDNQARLRALDLGYKVRGSYAAQKIKFEDPNEDLTDEEIENELARRSAEITRLKNN